MILKQRLQLRLLTFNTVGHLIRYAFQKSGKTLHKEGFNKLTIKIESKKWKKAKTKIIVIPFLLKTILVEPEVIRDRTSKTNICVCLTKTWKKNIWETKESKPNCPLFRMVCSMSHSTQFITLSSLSRKIFEVLKTKITSCQTLYNYYAEIYRLYVWLPWLA